MAFPPDLHASLVSVFRALAPDMSDSALERHAATMIMNEVLSTCDPTVGRRGTNAALKTLVDINKKAFALVGAILKMERDEGMALTQLQAPSKEELVATVAEVNQYIVAAYRKLAGATTIPARTKKNLAAERLSQSAARSFLQITGKQPTWNNRHGAMSAFGTFLSGTFRAFGIKANVEHYAKMVVAGEKGQK